MSPPWFKNIHLYVFKKTTVNSERVMHESYIKKTNIAGRTVVYYRLLVLFTTSNERS